ncbi:hypothetical protein DFJ77DRAFT_60227 [Powellomyces hirtus]|nr:hypothetical protein DFJ77DRAFT_60227 [Powellomyces hirtus]
MYIHSLRPLMDLTGIIDRLHVKILMEDVHYFCTELPSRQLRMHVAMSKVEAREADACKGLKDLISAGRLQELDLIACDEGNAYPRTIPKLMQPVYEAFAMNQTISSLRIDTGSGPNSFLWDRVDGCTGLSTLVKCLMANKVIRKLHLKARFVTKSDLTNIADLLYKNNGLQVLLLHACAIPDEETTSLAMGLKHNTRLRYLDINVNFTETGRQNIVKSFRSKGPCHKLFHLKVDDKEGFDLFTTLLDKAKLKDELEEARDGDKANFSLVGARETFWSGSKEHVAWAMKSTGRKT